MASWKAGSSVVVSWGMRYVLDPAAAPHSVTKARSAL